MPRSAVSTFAPHHVTENLTVIIPAYNEERTVLETIQSLTRQTHRPKKIIVVDDCSTDHTGDVAHRAGVTVIRPVTNTGSKAGAQNVALKTVRTAFTMALDADTILAPDAIEKLSRAFRNKEVAAASGFVIPRYIKSVWERGRYIEYLLAFTYYKAIQEYFGKPLIASGCFSMYRTDILRKLGGWNTRTMAEDMDLTWTFYEHGLRVHFMPSAVCYPIDPETYTLMRKQLRRWSHGFVQNVRLHWRHLVKNPYLGSIVAVGLWDGIIASFAYLFLIPLSAVLLQTPIVLLAYVIDAPLTLIPVLLKGIERRESVRVLTSFPSYFVLRLVNAWSMLEACWSELVLGRRLTEYEKGH